MADEKNDYGVGIEEAEFDALLSGDKETPDPEEGKEEGAEGKGEGEEGAEGDLEDGGEESTPDKKVKIGDEEYSEQSILDSLKIAKNMKDFRAKNQQNSMLNAEQRKKIEPVIKLMNSMRENGEALENVREVIADKLGEETLGVFDTAIKFDSEEYKHPDSDKATKVEKENQELKSQIKLREIVEEFRVDNKLKVATGKEIEKFIMEKHTKEGIAFSPEEAYKILNFDKVKKKAEEKAKPPEIEVPSKNKGAEKIKGEEKPTTSYDDVKITDEDGIFASPD